MTGLSEGLADTHVPPYGLALSEGERRRRCGQESGGRWAVTCVPCVALLSPFLIHAPLLLLVTGTRVMLDAERDKMAADPAERRRRG